MDVLLFGVTKDIIGTHQLTMPDDVSIKTVAQLKTWLSESYPGIKKLNSLAVAVNNEYAEDNVLITPGCEIALLPPVSGG